MRTRRATAAVSAVLLLAACSSEVQGVASPGAGAAPPSTTTPESAPPPSEEPGEPGSGASEKSGPAMPGSTEDPAGAPRVTGFTFQSDGSSARLVVNLSSSGVPEWTATYSEATGPDGRPVDIAGDAFLRVRVRSGAGSEGQGSSRSSVSFGPVAEARTLGASGGYEEVLIGVRGGEQPFTVEAITDPGRLVIDLSPAG
ncbi:AMIN-like domain-containing (lipo)protein [Blastococcus litoris]|uniref:AMIN-like domain-containing (lipo)protein n=1 Tax=Blastococcus litoris TaxID=2171622 RepID=UPI000E3043B5|nr:hypothetical protein [Blastococcus litoris]